MRTKRIALENQRLLADQSVQEYLQKTWWHTHPVEEEEAKKFEALPTRLLSPRLKGLHIVALYERDDKCRGNFGLYHAIVQSVEKTAICVSWLDTLQVSHRATIGLNRTFHSQSLVLVHRGWLRICESCSVDAIPLMIQQRPPSSESSTSQVPPLQDDSEDSQELPCSRYFVVNFFVAAVGFGNLPSNAPYRVKELANAVKNQQRTPMTLSNGETVSIPLRVFMDHTADAKTLKDWILRQPFQTPAPFVILAEKLPIALRYDQSILDPSDRAVTERLYKQAKKRAIKCLRTACEDHKLGVTEAMLCGFSGALAPAETIHEVLQNAMQHFEPGSVSGFPPDVDQKPNFDNRYAYHVFDASHPDSGSVPPAALPPNLTARAESLSRKRPVPDRDDAGVPASETPPSPRRTGKRVQFAPFSLPPAQAGSSAAASAAEDPREPGARIPEDHDGRAGALAAVMTRGPDHGVRDHNPSLPVGHGHDQPESPEFRLGVGEREFKVGDKVEGRFRDGYFYSARIVGRTGDRFLLAWSDGDRRDKVKGACELRLPGRPAAGSSINSVTGA